MKGLDDDLGAAKQLLAEIELDDRESRDNVARSIKHIKSLKEVALDKLFVSRIIHALKLKENGKNSLAGTALLCAIEGLRAGHPLRRKIKSEDPNFREVLSKDPSNLPKLSKKKPTK